MKRLTWRRLAVGAVAVFCAPLVAPQVLAFPYVTDSHGSRVWSETPLPRERIDAVMARSAGLVAQSALADRAGEPRHIFLTNGGWRWTWLALQSWGAFGLTRALNEAVIINRSDVVNDLVSNGATLGGTRTLSGVIAHETCHGMERRAFGLVAADIRAPTWLREGYCDHVAQESSLSDAEAANLKARGESHPALPYCEGRRRVAEALAANGGNVRALFMDR